MELDEALLIDVKVVTKVDSSAETLVLKFTSAVVIPTLYAKFESLIAVQ